MTLDQHSSSQLSRELLSSTQLESFAKDGYLLIKGWERGKSLSLIQETAQAQVMGPIAPVELEAQLGYPGAPSDVNQDGGDTPRRLLRAFGRSPVWDAYACSKKMHACLQQLFNHDSVFLSQAHHNCLMTKSPRFSSDTGWHRDSRYWHFEQNELITAWLALSEEFEGNGSLRVIPGSHRLELKARQFDTQSFFKENLDENTRVLAAATALEMSPGDLLFFHCDLLHSASRNNTKLSKLSLVFTYFDGENNPIANTRSDGLPSIPLNTGSYPNF